MSGKPEKTVGLERILGIGGEGIVLSDKMTTKEYHFRKGFTKLIYFFIQRFQLEEKKGREVAVKFVKFEKDEKEDFEEPEQKDVGGFFGGIDINGNFVDSQYFRRLVKLGDFKGVTHISCGYGRQYIDFGISKINERYFYVIGELKVIN